MRLRLTPARRPNQFLRLGLGHYYGGMTEPSAYEIDAWRNIQRFRGRPLSHAMRNAGEQMTDGAAKLRKRTTEYLGRRPSAQAVVSRGQDLANTISTKARQAVEAIPDGLTDWGGAVLGPAQQTAGRIARVGISPKGIVKKHVKLGHDVALLSEPPERLQEL